MKINIWLFALFAATCANAATFSVASIKPSAADVKFENDGKTEITPGSLTMRDVTVNTCIKFAYGVQDIQISGPESLKSDRFDILAKADAPVGVDELRLMMQTLLADRFRLTFHRQTKELSSYAMTIAKGGHKLKESPPGTVLFRQNTAISTIARGITMKEFADFLAGPLRTPIVDKTGLSGKYDFVLDFSHFIPGSEQAMKVSFDDTNGIVLAAMQAELGLKMESKKESVEVLVIDHLEKPSEN